MYTTCKLHLGLDFDMRLVDMQNETTVILIADVLLAVACSPFMEGFNGVGFRSSLCVAGRAGTDVAMARQPSIVTHKTRYRSVCVCVCRCYNAFITDDDDVNGLRVHEA